jgi:aryl-alcohol dehydrogenase-like predicted oxidoreductase
MTGPTELATSCRQAWKLIAQINSKNMSMELRAFGTTGFETTPVSFGAMRINENEKGVSVALLDALQKGVNFIDTARNYGESERIVGQTLKQWNGEKPFIATKVKPKDVSNWRFYVPIEQQFTRESITRSVEDSLKTMGLECLDLVQLHQWYYLWGHNTEWLETLLDLKTQGKLRFIGVSAQDHEHDAVLSLVEGKLVDSVQILFNAFESRPFVSAFPLCEMRKVGTIIRCVYDHAGSLATGGSVESCSADVKLGNASKEMVREYLNRIQRLKSCLQEHDVSLPELAIRLPLSHPGVSNIAASMSSPARVDQAIGAAEKGPLSEELLQQVLRDHVWVKNFYYFSKNTVDGNKIK